MNSLLIIGYGNPLRGDDGVGLIAAERLGEWLDARALERGWSAGVSPACRERGRLARMTVTRHAHPPWCAMRTLHQEPPADAQPQGSRIEVIARHCLTPELAADLARHHRALFIDAALDDPPGKVRCRQLWPQTVGWEPRAHPTSSPGQDGPDPSPSLIHALTPAELLAWSLWLYGTAPRSSLITIGAESFAYREGLSPAVERALARLLRRLIGLGERLLYQR